MIGRLLLLFALCAAIILACMGLVTLAPSYKYCRAGHATEEKYKDSHYTDDLVPVSGGTFLDCESFFANRNGDAFTGLATLLLTFVTLGLGYLAWDQGNATRAQTRAYVFLDEVGMMDGPTPPWVLSITQALSGCPQLNTLIRNLGKTPAYNVKHFSEIIFTQVNPDGSLPKGTLVYPTEDEWEKYGPTAIGPNGFTTLSRNLQRVLTAGEVQAMSATHPAFALIGYGRIRYETFGRTQTTDYALGYAGPYPIPPGTKFTLMKDGTNAD